MPASLPVLHALAELMRAPAGPSDPAWRTVGDFFAAMTEPQRLTLLARLAGCAQPLTVTEASTCCGVHLSGVSRHLAILRQIGVVSAEKRGREVYYALHRKELAVALRGVADWIEAGTPCGAGATGGCCGPTTAPSRAPGESL